MHTSILDRFTTELCDAVTGRDDGDAMLCHCERHNLFLVPLDGHGGWYRYHHLFADTLRERLSGIANDTDIAAMHRRAATWLEANGHVEDATRHAIAGRAWAHAVRLLEVVCAELFAHDHIATLRSWLQGIPADALAMSPRLTLGLAWADGRTGHWSVGSEALRIAEEVWTASGDQAGEGLILLWHAVRALFAMNNRQAIEYAQRA